MHSQNSEEDNLSHVILCVIRIRLGWCSRVGSARLSALRKQPRDRCLHCGVQLCGEERRTTTGQDFCVHISLPYAFETRKIRGDLCTIFTLSRQRRRIDVSLYCSLPRRLADRSTVSLDNLALRLLGMIFEAITSLIW